ncbi:MAG TPA: hypothetical protein VK489_09090 [Ferruginibacter sp.]|nr:hypothetical protein [Ferruginibacter sp.]
MRVPGKNITALGLLLLLAIPLIFSITVVIKQKVLQYQRRARFESEVLQTIRISPEKLYWIKPEKEILVDGKMFDVKSYHKEGDKISVTGFFDHKEEKMVNHMNTLLHQKSKPSSPYGHAMVKFLMLPLYHEPAGFSIQDNWKTIAQQFLNYTELIPTISYDAVAPPPKYC